MHRRSVYAPNSVVSRRRTKEYSSLWKWKIKAQMRAISYQMGCFHTPVPVRKHCFGANVGHHFARTLVHERKTAVVVWFIIFVHGGEAVKRPAVYAHDDPAEGKQAKPVIHASHKGVGKRTRGLAQHLSGRHTRWDSNSLTYSKREFAISAVWPCCTPVIAAWLETQDCDTAPQDLQD